ncbi:quinone oxidoreductase family protein [Microbacterium saperdae]|uniref:NADPH:quinone reductase-like Zn-dependent oxidoreductase n=1 Tax=Microbacterium saperdae TaxID=69368 RepID=A0A543BM10_9MICO|nr:NADP-dependent oxidoreductase [Microbacterium saperdae]TQL85867.1 NADPH:quinone reductase-like Zn-dependent oxidoreductase [Microbacterium saperdae]GGM52483.1 putative oxidoreductase [Microbacterium saperdae]
MAQHWIATTAGAPEAWTFEEYDVAEPAEGEVTIRVHAAGVNPADAKHVAAPRAGLEFPVPIGYEISGEITAIGPRTRIGSGDAEIGDEVVAFRIYGGYATDIAVPAAKVFAKPTTLTHPEAANLLLAGTTAAEMLSVVGAAPGETILLHGASGAVGVSVLQQAHLRGIRVIGTASEERFAEIRRFGGIPVRYGVGLLDRVRQAAGAPLSAALDAVGTDEAIDTSLELVADPRRIFTIAAFGRASEAGILAIAGSMPASATFRDEVRGELTALAQNGDLVVPVARTYPLDQAPEAHRFLATGHPGGKIALIP